MDQGWSPAGLPRVWWTSQMILRCYTVDNNALPSIGLIAREPFNQGLEQPMEESL